MSRRYLSAAIITVLVFAACGQDESETPLVPADYAGWESTAEGPLTYQIPGHTMPKRLIYINAIGRQVEGIEKDGKISYDYPKGTIIAKEMYPTTDSNEADHLTVMIKNPEHPKAVVGWIWLTKNLKNGQERILTGQEFCVACHRNANERHPYGDRNADGEFRDYVYYPWNSP